MFRKALVGLFACSFFLSAQTTTTLYGTVTDKSGAIVPGAQVVATNIGTNQSRTAQTSQEDDGDGLGGGAHLELDVEAQFLVDLEFEIRVAVGGESAGRGVQGVAAGVEVGGGEIARAVADTAMGLVGFEVGYLNGDGGDDGAGRICDAADDAGGRGLGGQGKQGTENERQQGTHRGLPLCAILIRFGKAGGAAD